MKLETNHDNNNHFSANAFIVFAGGDIHQKIMSD